MTIFKDYLSLFAANCQYSWLFITILVYSMTIHHYSQLFVTICDYSLLFMTICTICAICNYSLFGFSRHSFTWYKVHLAGGQALLWDIRNKGKSWLVKDSLFLMSKCIAYPSATCYFVPCDLQLERTHSIENLVPLSPQLEIIKSKPILTHLHRFSPA